MPRAIDTHGVMNEKMTEMPLWVANSARRVTKRADNRARKGILAPDGYILWVIAENMTRCVLVAE
jgi:hypothetical protein